jgi:hypothetical protein
VITAVTYIVPGCSDTSRASLSKFLRSAPVKKKVLLYKSRKGCLEETLDVAPGDHIVRVRFDWDDNVATDSIQGHFVSGRTRHLSITMGGLIKKRLKLEWE